MKQFVGLNIRIEGNKVFINKEPETPEEKELLDAAIGKACASMLDSMARAAIMEGMKQHEENQP